MLQPLVSKGTILDEDNERPIGMAEVFRGRWASIGHLFVMRRRELEFTQVHEQWFTSNPSTKRIESLAIVKPLISRIISLLPVSLRAESTFLLLFLSSPSSEI